MVTSPANEFLESDARPRCCRFHRPLHTARSVSTASSWCKPTKLEVRRSWMHHKCPCNRATSIVVVYMSTVVSTRTAPREFAITIAQGQDTLCNSPIVFLGRHKSRVKAFNVLSWKGICSRGRNKRWLTPSVWSKPLTASTRLTRPDMTRQQNVWEVNATEL